MKYQMKQKTNLKKASKYGAISAAAATAGTIHSKLGNTNLGERIIDSSARLKRSNQELHNSNLSENYDGAGNQPKKTTLDHIKKGAIIAGGIGTGMHVGSKFGRKLGDSMINQINNKLKDVDSHIADNNHKMSQLSDS